MRGSGGKVAASGFVHERLAKRVKIRHVAYPPFAVSHATISPFSRPQVVEKTPAGGVFFTAERRDRATAGS
jgi:hypothetical protein